MGFIYIVISLFGFWFFLLNKRRLDFLTIGFISQQLYFSPCIFYLFSPSTLVYGMHYGVYLTGAILVILFIFFSYNMNFKMREKKYLNLGFEYHLFYTTCLAFLAFFISFYQAGPTLLMGAKSEVLDSLNRFYIIWAISSIYGLCISVYFKNKKYLLLNLILILFTIYIGFRSIAAIAAISLLVVIFTKKNEKVNLILENYGKVLFAVFAGLFFLVYKGLYIAIKFKNYDQVFSDLTDKEFYLKVIYNAEPFGIQRIFSDIIEYQYFIGMENFNRIILTITLFGDSTGISDKSFNDYFQPELYGDVGYGMGSNIWAHMYSSGGEVLLMIFMIVYALSLRCISVVIYNCNERYIPILSILGAYWAFYIHRNDLFYQLTLEKRVFLIFVIVSILGWFTYEIKSQYRVR